MQKTPTGSGGAPSSWGAFSDAQGTNSSDRNAQEYIDFPNKTHRRIWGFDD